MLNQITPVILTLNEEANIARCLEQLQWARHVLVLDSGSADKTEKLCAGFDNVTFTKRDFDDHAHQWAAAVTHNTVTTDWVLTLDADYMLTESFKTELSQLSPSKTGASAYKSEFIYCIDGQPLPRSLYPPRVVLARREALSFYMDGHTQRQRIVGPVHLLGSSLLHDDRKPEILWLESQRRYAKQEAAKLLGTAPPLLKGMSFVRKYLRISPVVVNLYLGLFKRLWFAGPTASHYIQQRVYFERLLQDELRQARKKLVT